jgi:hypothetical protein
MQTQEASVRVEREMVPGPGQRDESVVGPVSEFRVVKPSRNPPLKIELKKREFVEEPDRIEQGHSCIVQDNQGAESRNLQSKSEGQLRILTFTVGVVESLP